MLPVQVVVRRRVQTLLISIKCDLRDLYATVIAAPDSPSVVRAVDQNQRHGGPATDIRGRMGDRKPVSVCPTGQARCRLRRTVWNKAGRQTAHGGHRLPNDPTKPEIPTTGPATVDLRLDADHHHADHLLRVHPADRL